MNDFELAAKIGCFIADKVGSCWGYYCCRMSKADQMSLLGRYIGKGLLTFDGQSETVTQTIKVCFGTDYDENYRMTFDGVVITDNR